MIINQHQINFAEQIFKLLSNEKRIRILYLLENHSFNVSELSEQLELPQPSVSHQLALLRQYQLVQAHRDGKQIFYTLDDPHIIEVLNDMLAHVQHTMNHRDHWNHQI
ncbi:ArsR/SmtB family transcription factor [Limosilactobacillus coleohominis]|uniref:ArsR/SmtB family transcription factor n=1 Tax=Limosilactobacillus coleohominis TaxID=181675 RepID=UPI00058D6C77|nr:metalloregulator ArsR/SmtB family transcription factor [Limosilactobacillus coleohominis]